MRNITISDILFLFVLLFFICLYFVELRNIDTQSTRFNYVICGCTFCFCPNTGMPSTMRIITGEDIYVQVYFYRSRLVNSHQKTVANFNLLVRRITTAWNTDIKYDH